MFQLESKNRPLALQQVKYWHTNVRVCLEDTNCLIVDRIVDRIVDGKGRASAATLLSRGYPTNKLSVLRVKVIVQRLSNQQIICLEGQNYCPEGIQLTNYLS